MKCPVNKKDNAKIKLKTMLPSIYRDINMKHYTVFIHETKTLKNMLIYHYYQILKISNIMS